MFGEDVCAQGSRRTLASLKYYYPKTILTSTKLTKPADTFEAKVRETIIRQKLFSWPSKRVKSTRTTLACTPASGSSPWPARPKTSALQAQILNGNLSSWEHHVSALQAQILNGNLSSWEHHVKPLSQLKITARTAGRNRPLDSSALHRPVARSYDRQVATHLPLHLSCRKSGAGRPCSSRCDC